MLYKDIYICCMENCGILNVAVILYARMWIEIIFHRLYLQALAVILYARMWIEIFTQRTIAVVATGHPLCEDVD